MSRTLVVAAVASLVALTSACGSPTKDDPEELSVPDAIAKAKADEVGWVKVTGKVTTTGFANSRTRHGWICDPSVTSGFSIQDNCVTCWSSGTRETIAGHDGGTLTMVGRLAVTGSGEVAFQECSLQ